MKRLEADATGSAFRICNFRRSALLIVSGLFVSLGVTAPSALGSADSGVDRRTQPVVLGAVNKVSFDEPSVVDVTLENRAVMHFPLFKRNRDLDITGSGRFVGIFLIPLDEEFDPKTSPWLLSGYYRTCEAEGCEGKVTYYTHPEDFEERDFDHVWVPAGRYRLFLINDGAPAEITWRLRGPIGRVSLHPTPTDGVLIREPATQLSTTPLENLFWGGQTDRIQRPTFAWTALWLAGSPSGMSDLGVCVYEGRPPGDERFAYMPDCGSKGAQEYRSFTIAGSTSFRETMLTWLSLTKGTWGHGVYYESTSVVEDAGALNVMVAY